MLKDTNFLWLYPGIKTARTSFPFSVKTFDKVTETWTQARSFCELFIKQWLWDILKLWDHCCITGHRHKKYIVNIPQICKLANLCYIYNILQVSLQGYLRYMRRKYCNICKKKKRLSQICKKCLPQLFLDSAAGARLLGWLDGLVAAICMHIAQHFICWLASWFADWHPGLLTGILVCILASWFADWHPGLLIGILVCWLVSWFVDWHSGLVVCWSESCGWLAYPFAIKHITYITSLEMSPMSQLVVQLLASNLISW